MQLVGRRSKGAHFQDPLVVIQHTKRSTKNSLTIQDHDVNVLRETLGNCHNAPTLKNVSEFPYGIFFYVCVVLQGEAPSSSSHFGNFIETYMCDDLQD